MSDKVTLYNISFWDVMLVVATKGFWILIIYWFHGVEVDAPEESDA